MRIMIETDFDTIASIYTRFGVDQPDNEKTKGDKYILRLLMVLSIKSRKCSQSNKVCYPNQ